MHDLITQITNEVRWQMDRKQITRELLAARMDISPGRVSQILGGTEDLSLITLTALADALDVRWLVISK